MIPFVKAHACSNDFLIIEEKFAGRDRAAIARSLCNRHTGIGADGVEWVSVTDNGVRASLSNADGSSAEISGNGTRCVAAWFAHQNRAVEQVVIGTDAGERLCRILGSRAATFQVETQMGQPKVSSHEVAGYFGVSVSLGNPHFVLLGTIPSDWERIGAELCVNAAFPEGSNIEFAQRTSDDSIELRIYERGAGPNAFFRNGLLRGSGRCNGHGWNAEDTAGGNAGRGTDCTLAGSDFLDWASRINRARRGVPVSAFAGKPLLRGPALQMGDTIGVVAPASGFDEAAMQVGISTLLGIGYEVREGRNIHQRCAQYLAGTPEQRADDLHEMFRSPDVRLVLCARGGFGSQGVLPLLELDVIRANPKPILGCSDVSALQLWLLERTGVVPLHGPMVAGDFGRDDGVDISSWEAATSGVAKWQIGEEAGLQSLKSGAAQGVLWGGCLSILVSSLGTPFELLQEVEEDLILFVEDVAEKPYQIERMLLQWKSSGKMRRVKGIVFGEMLHCEQPNANYNLRDVLRRVLVDFDGPVAVGLRSGHVSRGNITLPLGVQAELHCDERVRLTIKQAAMVAG